MKSQTVVFTLLIIFVALLSLCFCAESANEENEVDEKQLEYAKGSVCGYCEYCKFCKLCDEDCPCERSATKPNCHMCKYCKYCYLCKSICDTICQPGGILDRVSSSIVNALPSHNPDEIEQDIAEVKDWIDKEEL